MTAAVVAVTFMVVLVLLWLSVLRIRPQQAAVLERGGRFRGVAEPGLTVVVPFVDRVRARVDLREQVITFAPQTVQASDGPVTVTPTLHFRVTDPQAAVYGVPNYVLAVEQAGKRALQDVVGRMTRAEASDAAVAEQLAWRLEQVTGRWGVRVTTVGAVTTGENR